MPAERQQPRTDIKSGLPITAMPERIPFAGKGMEVDIGIFDQSRFINALGGLAAGNGFLDFTQLTTRKTHPGIGIGQQTVVTGLFSQGHCPGEAFIGIHEPVPVP